MRSIKEAGEAATTLYALDPSEAAAAVAVPAETLVVYTYSKSDPEYERNLEYFVAHGMWEGDGCQYLIIVQQVRARPVRRPTLPVQRALWPARRTTLSAWRAAQHFARRPGHGCGGPGPVSQLAAAGMTAADSHDQPCQLLLTMWAAAPGRCSSCGDQPLSAPADLAWLQGNGLFEAGSLPQLPSNAQYIYHENRCYDWGTFGWALGSGKVDPSKYRHIVFMNSSIRGPFLPPYWPVRRLRCLQPSMERIGAWLRTVS